MEEFDVDGREVKEGRLIGKASYFPDANEWRALIALHSGALATCALKITIEPMWEDRQV